MNIFVERLGSPGEESQKKEGKRSTDGSDFFRQTSNLLSPGKSIKNGTIGLETVKEEQDGNSALHNFD